MDKKVFELEAYWGSPDGLLLHGTIQVKARSMSEAIALARADQIIPPNPEDHFDSVARDEYSEDRYDVEPLGEGNEDLFTLENWKAVMRALLGHR